MGVQVAIRRMAFVILIGHLTPSFGAQSSSSTSYMSEMGVGGFFAPPPQSIRTSTVKSGSTSPSGPWFQLAQGYFEQDRIEPSSPLGTPCLFPTEGPIGPRPPPNCSRPVSPSIGGVLSGWDAFQEHHDFDFSR